MMTIDRKTWALLTDRERDIVKMIQRGLTREQVAEELGPESCERMVRSHLSNIAMKLGFASRHAVEAYLRQRAGQ